MIKIRAHIIALLTVLTVISATSCRHYPSPDPRRRAVADGLNKEAFVNRYRLPDSCIAISERALQYIADSLPEYIDGILRARNNMAFAYYQLSNHEAATEQLDLIDRLIARDDAPMRNADIEAVIADLLRARLLQRACRIADSYRLLYDIDRSQTLARRRDHLLYNYAQTEYYITSLVLNFHYRQGKEGDISSLLDEVELRRPHLRVDYAQDMALNYAIAYGYQSIGESLIALDYCDRNFDLLELGPSAWCDYQYANTLQMAAFALRSMPGTVPPDSVLSLYDSARVAFFAYGDPYQMLGGVTSTARYALSIGDTSKAHDVLDEWMTMRGTWTPFSAPKMELSLFDLLLRSRMASSGDEARRWYEHYAELQEYIKQGEQEDFTLQTSLFEATRRSHWLAVVAWIFAALGVALAVMVALLVQSSRHLRREKQQLQAAQRRDVERIANVETCLSVIRHDISPFISYLQKPDLSPDLRDEVLTQLTNTFDNVKSWTRLSIPTGLAFRAEKVGVQEIFDAVRSQVIRPHAGVELLFEPSHLTLYADRQLSIILLRNITTNALQHTTQGSVTLRATLHDEKWVELLVADTGSGMTAEQRESLFRADRAPQGDHGFGLLLCRYIIKKHDDLTRRGCRLWVESQENRGTTVHILLASGEA